MQNEVVKLFLGVVIITAIVLAIGIAAQLIDRKNVLDRVINWPDFQAQTLEGDDLASSELLSGRPILFNYFSTQCTFCQAEISDIADYEQLKEVAILVFISEEEANVIKQFRRDFELEDQPEFLFLLDSDSQIKDYFGIRTVPATYLYNREGELIEYFRGQIKAETLYSHIAAEAGEDG